MFEILRTTLHRSFLCKGRTVHVLTSCAMMGTLELVLGKRELLFNVGLLYFKLLILCYVGNFKFLIGVSYKEEVFLVRSLNDLIAIVL